jgi:hypothetical protein
VTTAAAAIGIPTIRRGARARVPRAADPMRSHRRGPPLACGHAASASPRRTTESSGTLPVAVFVSAAFDYFFLTGALGVVFALTISVLGLMSSRFPGRALPALMAVSVLLFIAGIVGAAVGAKHKAGERHGPPEGTSVAGHGSG